MSCSPHAFTKKTTISYSDVSLSLTKGIVLIEKSPQNNKKPTRPNNLIGQKFVKIRNLGSAFRENTWWAAQKLYKVQIKKNQFLKEWASWKCCSVLGSSLIWKCRILNIQYLLVCSICRRSGKNQNKYSKFKIRRVQIDELLRTLAKKSKLSLSEGWQELDYSRKLAIWAMQEGRLRMWS